MTSDNEDKRQHVSGSQYSARVESDDDEEEEVNNVEPRTQCPGGSEYFARVESDDDEDGEVDNVEPRTGCSKSSTHQTINGDSHGMNLVNNYGSIFIGEIPEMPSQNSTAERKTSEYTYQEPNFAGSQRSQYPHDTTQPRLPPRTVASCLKTTISYLVDMSIVETSREPSCDYRGHNLRDDLTRALHEKDDAKLYVCLDCDGRALCQVCLRPAMQAAHHPHEADHRLCEWSPTYTFSIAKNTAARDVQVYDQPWTGKSLAEVFLKNDSVVAASPNSRSRPSAQPVVDIVYRMSPSAGLYTMRIDMEAREDTSQTGSASIGLLKSLRKKIGIQALGTISFGCSTLPATSLVERLSCCVSDAVTDRKMIEYKEVHIIPGKTAYHLEFPKVHIHDGRSVDILTRARYNPAVYRKGSPFVTKVIKISFTHPKETFNHASEMDFLEMRERKAHARRGDRKDAYVDIVQDAPILLAGLGTIYTAYQSRKVDSESKDWRQDGPVNPAASNHSFREDLSPGPGPRPGSRISKDDGNGTSWDGLWSPSLSSLFNNSYDAAGGHSYPGLGSRVSKDNGNGTSRAGLGSTSFSSLLNNSYDAAEMYKSTSFYLII